MEKINKVYAVTVTAVDDAPEVKVFTNYNKAKAYFLELLGKYFLSILMDNKNNSTDGGIREDGLGNALLCNKTTFFESGKGLIKKLPDEEKTFIDEYAGIASINVAYWLYTIQVVEEVSE